MMLVFLASEGVLTGEDDSSAAGSGMTTSSILTPVDWRAKDAVSSGRNCFLSGFWEGSLRPRSLHCTSPL